MALALLFGSAFLIGLTGAAMPGPMLSVTLERTARYGWFAGPIIVLGHALLELVLIVAIIFGFGHILSSQTFTGLFGIFGGAFLFWMGFGVVRDAAGVSLPKVDLANHGGDQPPWRRVPMVTALFGATTSLSNPYWLLWWGSVGAGYVAIALQLGFPGVLAFFLGHISADFGWYTLMAYLMDKSGNLLPQSVLTWLLRILGLFLIIFAGYFVWTGAHNLLELKIAGG